MTRKDYDDILVPAVTAALRGHEKVRLYYEVTPKFSGMEAGAMWEDFQVGMGHLTRWERVAVVTDVEWIRHTINAFGFLLPGKLRIFACSETGAAREWVIASKT